MKKNMYPGMYFVENSGKGKFREVLPGQYFTIIQPNDDAVGQGASVYNHALLFMSDSREDLAHQVNEFVRRNHEGIDFNESNKLVEMISSYKKNMPRSLAKGNSYAEISDYIREEIPLAKAMRRTVFGPENSKWWVNDNYPTDKILRGQDRKPSPLTYAWWI